MYARVKAHPGTRHLYAQQLIREGVITEDDLKQMTDEVVEKYEGILAARKADRRRKTDKSRSLPRRSVEEDGSDVLRNRRCRQKFCKQVSEKISLVPEGFHINPKMVGQLARRAKMGTGEVPMDWGFAEAMAIGSLVLEGYPGSPERAGFGPRNILAASRVDVRHDDRRTLDAADRASKREEPERAFLRFRQLACRNRACSVSNTAIRSIAPNELVMWEAQFGDFANGAQVIIDQYIAASEDKWQQKCRLVMLLPHGYEGQGPEHSSARLERYLQLCAENNLQVCYPTTPAQYFHLLRRQVKQEIVRPLIVMTPKSLLRLPAASSTMEELTTGGFQPVIDDAAIADKSAVKRIVVVQRQGLLRSRSGTRRCSTTIASRSSGSNSFIRSRRRSLKEIFASYPNATQIFWTQEEPQNMGGWTFVEPRLRAIRPKNVELRYVGRAASASPATGSYAIHELEQKQIVNDALIIDTGEISAASEPEVSEKFAPASS